MLLVHLHREAEIQEYAEKEKKKKGERRWFASDGFATSRRFTTFCYLEVCEALLHLGLPQSCLYLS